MKEKISNKTFTYVNKNVTMTAEFPDENSSLFAGGIITNANKMEINQDNFFSDPIVNANDIKWNATIGDIKINNSLDLLSTINTINSESAGKQDNDGNGEIFNIYNDIYDEDDILKFNKNNAIGEFSHAEGKETIAAGEASHAEGSSKIITTEYDLVIKNDTGHAVDFKSNYFEFMSIPGKNSEEIIKLLNSLQNNYVNFGYKNSLGQIIKDDTKYKIINTGISKDNCYFINTYETLNPEFAKSINIKNYSLYLYTEELLFNTAKGNYSHAEGQANIVAGNSSHGEGTSNVINGNYAHAEGYINTVNGEAAHAEGSSNTANGIRSHAEGGSNIADGNYSHVEGYKNIATNSFAHAEGRNTHAENISSHTEGSYTNAKGVSSHAEGVNNITNKNAEGAHTEGFNNISEEKYSHTEGVNNITYGLASHAEGINADIFIEKNLFGAIIINHDLFYSKDKINNIILLEYSERQLRYYDIDIIDNNIININNGKYTLYLSVNNNIYTIINIKKIESGSIFDKKILYECKIKEVHVKDMPDAPFKINPNLYLVKDIKNNVNSLGGHIEGISNSIYAEFAGHAEGNNNIIMNNANYSHIEGIDNITYGISTHTTGVNNITYNNFESAFGKYNVSNKNLTLSSIGFGNFRINEDNRKNAVEVLNTGYTYMYGIGNYNGANIDVAKSLQDIINSKSDTGKETAEGGEIFNDYITNKAGLNAHAEGFQTFATGKASHAEGFSMHKDTPSCIYNLAKGTGSHVEGCSTYAGNSGSHAEGMNTTAYGMAAHAEGFGTFAYGNYSHTEGHFTYTGGNYSHAEGSFAYAIGSISHAEGAGEYATETFVANCMGSPENEEIKVNDLKNIFIKTDIINFELPIKEYKGAIININNGNGDISISTIIEDIDKDELGKKYNILCKDRMNPALNSSDLIEVGIVKRKTFDRNIYANGFGSHAEGVSTITKNTGEHAEGKYNLSNENLTLSSIGFGKKTNIGDGAIRKNAVEVLNTGYTYMYGIGNYDGTNITTAKSLQEIVNSLLPELNATLQNTRIELSKANALNESLNQQYHEKEKELNQVREEKSKIVTELNKYKTAYPAPDSKVE